MYKPIPFQRMNSDGTQPHQDDWGFPSLSSRERQPEQTFRTPLPNWAPGEFEQWKQAKMSGTPTPYGQRKQDRWQMRRHPGLISMMDRNEALAPKRALDHVGSIMNIAGPKSDYAQSRLKQTVEGLQRDFGPQWDDNLSPQMRALVGLR